MYSVYIHICPNKKVYIGVTGLNVEKRWGKNGILYKGRPLYEAVQKYGWENIKHLVVYQTESKEDAERKEKELIREYRSNDERFGYNKEIGGGIHYHTDETRRKMSSIRKGQPHSEAHNKAVGKSLKGKKLSPAQIENLRKSHIGYVMPESQKKHISESCKGKGTKEVIKMTLSGEILGRFKSLNDAAASVGGKSSSNISSCCKGRKKQAYGFLWKYAEGA